MVPGVNARLSGFVFCKSLRASRPRVNIARTYLKGRRAAEQAGRVPMLMRRKRIRNTLKTGRSAIVIAVTIFLSDRTRPKSRITCAARSLRLCLGNTLPCCHTAVISQNHPKRTKDSHNTRRLAGEGGRNEAHGDDEGVEDAPHVGGEGPEPMAEGVDCELHSEKRGEDNIAPILGACEMGDVYSPLQVRAPAHSILGASAICRYQARAI